MRLCGSRCASLVVAPAQVVFVFTASGRNSATQTGTTHTSTHSELLDHNNPLTSPWRAGRHGIPSQNEHQSSGRQHESFPQPLGPVTTVATQANNEGVVAYLVARTPPGDGATCCTHACKHHITAQHSGLFVLVRMHGSAKLQHTTRASSHSSSHTPSPERGHAPWLFGAPPP